MSYMVDDALTITVNGAIQDRRTTGNCDFRWFEAPPVIVIPGSTVTIHVTAEDYYDYGMSWFDMQIRFI